MKQKPKHIPQRRVTLQASSNGKQMTFTMDSSTEANIKQAQLFAEELLNLKCSAAVIIRRAIHYYVNLIMADGYDAKFPNGFTDDAVDWENLGKFLEQERQAMFRVAGRDDDGRH